MTEYWHLIITAPKDGRRFIAGYWDGDIWRFSVHRWDGKGFCAGKINDVRLYMSIKCTHWCNGPNPPDRIL